MDKNNKDIFTSYGKHVGVARKTWSFARFGVELVTSDSVASVEHAPSGKLLSSGGRSSATG